MVAVLVGGYSLWKWENNQQWKAIKKLSIMLCCTVAYAIFLGLPVVKQYDMEYNLHLSFKEHPAFTTWKKLQINWNVRKAQNYLKSLQVSPTAYIPPIDVANAENVSTPPGEPAYRGGINIAELQVDQPRGQTHAYFYYQVLHILAPDMDKARTAPPERKIAIMLEANDITDYFNSALWETPDPNLRLAKNSWPAKLWEVRQKLGDRFVDQMVAYTLQSLGDSPDEGSSHDPDVYFCRHLKIGEDRVDHKQQKWPEIVAILGHRYWNACRDTVNKGSY